MKFELSLTGWTAQIVGLQLPICKLVAPVKIDARQESDLYPSQSINCAQTIDGDYAISGIMWSDARIYAKVGPVDVILTNGTTCIWCFCSSRQSAFRVGARDAFFWKGMYYLVEQLDDSSPLTIEELP